MLKKAKRIIDSPEQRRLQAADGSRGSGIPQTWQHLLRDVLFKKLQRPSWHGIVAVDHCNRSRDTLSIVCIVCIDERRWFSRWPTLLVQENRSPPAITSRRVSFVRALSSIFENVRQRRTGQCVFHGRACIFYPQQLVYLPRSALRNTFPIVHVANQPSCGLLFATVGRDSSKTGLFGDVRGCTETRGRPVAGLPREGSRESYTGWCIIMDEMGLCRGGVSCESNSIAFCLLCLFNYAHSRIKMHTVR